MENKKKVMIVLSVAILVLIVIGSSYAYFVVGVSERAERNIRVTTSTTDTLLFEMGSDISFKATQSEFVESGNNVEGKTTAKAILKANNETNRATDHYYFYLDINKNDFVYTSDAQTAELILTIKKPDNSYVTSIDGLEYVTVGSVSGFDITESTDLIKIVENKEIVATSANNNTTEEEWELTITFVNLDNNQNENAGKTFEAKMIMQKEKINNLFADYIKNLYTTDGVNGMYLFDGAGTYTNASQEINDGSIRYAGFDYKLTSKATNAGYTKILENLITLGTGNNNFNTLLNYFDFRLAYNTTTQYNGYKKALDQAVTDGYLTDDNIKNYVCFGSDASTCLDDNLYRIIGVFGDRVKLIKYDFATDTHLGLNGDASVYEDNGQFVYDYVDHVSSALYQLSDKQVLYYTWNNYESKVINGTTYNNVWDIGRLNKINLNTNYLNYLDNQNSKWRNLITGNKYAVGGVFLPNSLSPTLSSLYNLEIKNPSTEVTPYHKSRVGLMYLSDFLYAIDPNGWDISTNKLTSKTVERLDSWLFSGQFEFTITRGSNASNKKIVFVIQNDTTIQANGRGNSIGYAIRPVFYLSSGAVYVSGNGTKTNPYRIS